MGRRKPTLCIIAGPNGSGKTTTTEQLLSNEWGADSLYIISSHNIRHVDGANHLFTHRLRRA